MKTLLHLAGLLLLLPLLGCSSDQNSNRSQAMKPREFRVSLQAPDGGWSVQIQRVAQVGEEIWVLAQLQRSSGMAIQAITEVEDSVSAEAPPLPERVFVSGKTWGWENEQSYEFVPTLDPLLEQVEVNGVVLWGRAE
jgi:hypothetical protein